MEHSSSKRNRRLRSLPSVEKVLLGLGVVDLPRAWVVSIVRRELNALRQDARKVTLGEVLEVIQARLRELHRSRLQPVINGTGILLHTNLGRAPLAPSALDALHAVAAGYSNLEYDLSSGQRGSRSVYLERSLALACSAAAATVVNNCAGALVLILKYLTRGDRKEVVISRGELIQIGGGFRIPEILETSGAQLREVGTTNRTTLSDYARAIGRNTALVLKVHRSNFFMEGFVESPSTDELAALARRKRITLVEDLGSGALIDTARFAAVDHEPTPNEVLKQGVDLVCFSGDKLMGGPQAGIIAGRARLITGLKQDPFFRALRCDKLILGALQATTEFYLDYAPEHRCADWPLLAMLSASETTLVQRAERLAAALRRLPVQVRVGHRPAQIGGGTLPRAALASVTLELLPSSLPAIELARRLRQGCPPLVGTLAGGRLRIDLRTVFPKQDDALVTTIATALEPPQDLGASSEAQT